MCNVDVHKFKKSKCPYNKMLDSNTEIDIVQVYVINTKRLSDFVDYWLSFT